MVYKYLAARFVYNSSDITYNWRKFARFTGIGLKVNFCNNKFYNDVAFIESMI